MKENVVSTAADTLLISEQIYENLKQSILNGEQNRNAFLTEVSVAKRFHVSRTPAHEALSKLEADRLIVAIPRKGYKVFTINEQDLADLYTMAIALSALSAQYAAIHRTPEQLEALRGIIRDGSALSPSSPDDGLKLIKNNFDFHVGVASASGNPYLEQHVTEVQEKLMLHRVYHKNYREVLSSGHQSWHLHSHERIFEAIEFQEAELAHYLMEKHLTHSVDTLTNTQKNEEI